MRLAAIKSLAKISNDAETRKDFGVLLQDESTKVRREAQAALAEMNSSK